MLVAVLGGYLSGSCPRRNVNRARRAPKGLRAGRGDIVFVNLSAGLRSASAGTAILRAAADALRQEIHGRASE